MMKGRLELLDNKNIDIVRDIAEANNLVIRRYINDDKGLYFSVKELNSIVPTLITHNVAFKLQFD